MSLRQQPSRRQQLYWAQVLLQSRRQLWKFRAAGRRRSLLPPSSCASSSCPLCGLTEPTGPNRKRTSLEFKFDVIGIIESKETRERDQKEGSIALNVIKTVNKCQVNEAKSELPEARSPRFSARSCSARGRMARW